MDMWIDDRIPDRTHEYFIRVSKQNTEMKRMHTHRVPYIGRQLDCRNKQKSLPYTPARETKQQVDQQNRIMLNRLVYIICRSN